MVYGAGLSKKLEDARPVVIPLESIAFCDQTNMLGAPIAFKHYFNPDELKEQEANGWGKKDNGATITIDELITLADEYKTDDPDSAIKNKSTTNSVEVYEIHGTLPEEFLTDKVGEQNKFVYQLQIVAFYKDLQGQEQGVILFRKKQKSGNLKVLLRDKIYSRAVGFGGAEELFEPQVWTNYSVIRQKNLLDAATTVILKTTDSGISARHPTGLKGMDNLEILDIQEGTDISQVDTTPRSMIYLDRFEAAMKDQAQFTSSAFDPQLGNSPSAGTPFKLQQLVTTEGKGMHKYRQGKYATHLEGVYMDWIIPHIAKQITNGSKFLSELSIDEMQYISDCLVRNLVADYNNKRVLNGENALTDQEKVVYAEKIKAEFNGRGNKHFIEILKGEFSKKPIKVKVNIKGKQKDLAEATDKLVNIWKMIFANPQAFQMAMQDPQMVKDFNEIRELSGMSPAKYSYQKPMQQASVPQQQPQQLVA